MCTPRAIARPSGACPPPSTAGAAGAPAAAAPRRRCAMVATAAERRGGKRSAEQTTAHQQLQERVNRMRYNLPFASQAALGAIMSLSAREELPVANRNAIRHSRDQAVAAVTEYGPIHKVVKVQSTDGEGIDLEVQNPQAMFAHMIKHNPSFARRVEAAYARKPPSAQAPWTIIVYGDEILPGNALAHTTNRKCWGIYWSLMELGPSTLTNEASRVLVAPMGLQLHPSRWLQPAFPSSSSNDSLSRTPGSSSPW